MTLEVSPSSVVNAARICQKAILPGGLIWFARQDEQSSRPGRDFISESIRAHLADAAQEARRADC